MAQRTSCERSLMFPFLLQTEEVKTIPTGACDAVSDRAQRGIMLALVLKAACQNGHSEDVPLIDTLDGRTSGRQSWIPVCRLPIALDLAPEAARRTQSQIKIVGKLCSALACPLAQISFGLRLQAPGDSPKHMRSIRGGRCFSE